MTLDTGVRETYKSLIIIIIMERLRFHWFSNLNESMMLLNPVISKKLYVIIREKYKYNEVIEKFRDISFLYQLRYNKPIRVKTLKNILATFNLDYTIYDKHIKYYCGNKIKFSINFPIDLDKKESAILIGAFMSDGNNQPQHPFYCNLSSLRKKILKSAQTFLPNIPYEVRDEKLRFHPILSRILLKLGVPIGNKTILNPKIPRFIYTKKEYKKEYLTQIFDDEGHAPTRISRKMVLGRSVALNNLPGDLVRNLIYNKKVYFNSLSTYIKEIVNKQPPNLLKGEYELLRYFGIKSSMKCRGITKFLGTISADWVIDIYGKENISRFNKCIGFSHPDKIKQINLYLESYKK